MQYFATSCGVPVHVSDSGSGQQVLLLLHGYLETLYIWEEFIELLPNNYRVISIDIPGHGLSSTHPEINSMKFCADVVLGVLDLANVTKCTICGHSMGGYIAQTCVKYYPDRFNAIVNFNSSPYADDPLKRLDRDREISFIESGKLLSLATVSIPNMYFKDNLRRCDDKIRETIDLCDTHDPRGIISSLRGLITREDNTDFLKTIKIPCFFIFGDSDTYMPLERAESILKTTNSKGVFIPSTAHNSFIENPHTTLDEFLLFLSQI